MFKKGIVLSSNSFSVFYIKTEFGFNRYVFCVSRVKKAVKRNAIKRKVRAILQSLKVDYQGFDIAVVANLKFLQLEHRDRVALCEKLLYKIN